MTAAVGDHALRAFAPIPEGYTTVTPWIISKDTAGLIAFLQSAFDALEISRMHGADGQSILHAEVRIGDAIVMLFDSPPGTAETPAFVRLFVEDADAAFGKAVVAGAVAITEPTHLAFGDTVARVRDPQGNIWWLQQRVEDVGEQELARRYADPEWQRGMDYMQGTLRDALGVKISP